MTITATTLNMPAPESTNANRIKTRGLSVAYYRNTGIVNGAYTSDLHVNAVSEAAVVSASSSACFEPPQSIYWFSDSLIFLQSGMYYRNFTPDMPHTPQTYDWRYGGPRDVGYLFQVGSGAPSHINSTLTSEVDNPDATAWVANGSNYWGIGGKYITQFEASVFSEDFTPDPDGTNRSIAYPQGASPGSYTALARSGASRYIAEGANHISLGTFGYYDVGSQVFPTGTYSLPTASSSSCTVFGTRVETYRDGHILFGEYAGGSMTISDVELATGTRVATWTPVGTQMVYQYAFWLSDGLRAAAFVELNAPPYSGIVFDLFGAKEFWGVADANNDYVEWAGPLGDGVLVLVHHYATSSYEWIWLRGAQSVITGKVDNVRRRFVRA